MYYIRDFEVNEDIGWRVLVRWEGWLVLVFIEKMRVEGGLKKSKFGGEKNKFKVRYFYN